VNARTVWTTGPQGQHVECGIVEHEGREYSAAGAYVSPEHLACYPHEDGTVRDWAGATLGTYRVISSRPAIFFGRTSWQGKRFYYMRATVRGRTYSLRGFGAGMLARGRAVKGAA
jgi:hypothetical protein